MGCGGSSSPDAGQDRVVQASLANAKQHQDKVKKLLLLGAGGSGKSTFFKQLQIIHGAGFSQAERMNFRSKIWEQILSNIKLLITKSRDFIEEEPNEWKHFQIQAENQEICDEFVSIAATSDLTPALAETVRQIWMDTGIQAAWKERALLCITDSTLYFMKDLDRIANDQYVPNDTDLVMNRYMTTGMTEKTFNINGSEMIIVDVGGQRSERRKWIHFFDGVTAVIFVTSLSAFDEVLFEDISRNVMEESLDVFDQIWKSHWFDSTAIILFLNKADLMQEKLAAGGSIKQAFPAYEGEDTFDESVAYVRAIYEKRQEDKSAGERHIYAHVTTATDPENVTRVFNDVQHIIINASLARNFLS